MWLFIKQKVEWNIKWYLEHNLRIIAVNLNYFKSISYFLFLTSKNKHEENENMAPKKDGILNDMETSSVDNYSDCVSINHVILSLLNCIYIIVWPMYLGDLI